MDSENELIPFPTDSIIVDLDYEYNPFDLIITALEISSKERGIENLIKIELKNIDEYQLLINNFLTQIVFCSFYQNKCKISTKNWYIEEKIPQLILASQIDEENNIVRFLGVMTSKEFEKYYLKQKSCSIPINEFEGEIDLLFDYVNCLEVKSIPIGDSLKKMFMIESIQDSLELDYISEIYNLDVSKPENNKFREYLFNNHKFKKITNNNIENNPTTIAWWNYFNVDSSSHEQIQWEEFIKNRSQNDNKFSKEDSEFKRYVLKEKDLLYRAMMILPKPDKGDIWLKLQGIQDPLTDEKLEYIIGLSFMDENNTDKYKVWWAHTSSQEEKAFLSWIDWVEDRLKEFPKLKIYHYGRYDKNAIKSLSEKYSTKKSIIDRWLRLGIFIDLLPIVYGSIELGDNNYSIKKVEKLYNNNISEGQSRDSVINYQIWSVSGEPEIPGGAPQKSPKLKKIELHNRQGSDSIKRLQSWLLDIKNQINSPQEEEKNFIATEMRNLYRKFDMNLKKSRTRLNPPDDYIKLQYEWNKFSTNLQIKDYKDKHIFLTKLIREFPPVYQKEELKLLSFIEKKEKSLKKSYIKRSKEDLVNIKIGNRSIERLISSNLNLLFSISFRYINQCWDIYALFSIALPILESSIEKFDSKKGIKLADYLDEKINTFFKQNIYKIDFQDLSFIESKINSLRIKLGRCPIISEIIQELSYEDNEKYGFSLITYERMIDSESEILGLIYSYLDKEYLTYKDKFERLKYKLLYDFYNFKNSMFSKDYPLIFRERNTKNDIESIIEWWYFFGETSKFFNINKISDISKIDKKEKLNNYISLLKKEYQEILKLRFGFIPSKHYSFNQIVKDFNLTNEELINIENDIRYKLKEVIFGEKESFVKNK